MPLKAALSPITWGWASPGPHAPDPPCLFRYTKEGSPAGRDCSHFRLLPLMDGFIFFCHAGFWNCLHAKQIRLFHVLFSKRKWWKHTEITLLCLFNVFMIRLKTFWRMGLESKGMTVVLDNWFFLTLWKGILWH